MAQNGQSDWKERFQEWHARHDGAHYTPIFNAALEALYNDELQCIECRVLAWFQRYQWGNHSDIPIRDGQTLYQKDCAADLREDKRRISDAVAFLESQNYLECRGRVVYLIDNPSSREANKKQTQVRHSPDFLEFQEFYKVRHSADFEALEVARSEVKRLQIVRLSAYKQWRATRTNGGAYNKEVELQNSYSASSSGSSSIDTATTTTAPPDETRVTQTQDPQIPQRAESVDPVAEALARYGTPDAEAVQTLIHDCREQAPECTVEEIAAAVHQKGAQGVRMRNAIGFLITAVPKVFFGRPTPQPQPPPVASPPGVCPHCSGSGFVGRIWTTWPEARMLFRAGVPFCDCEAGQENEREMRAEGTP